ncbi:ABC transporter permease [Streptomyces sp. NPDC046915]|uniref:ABC transporter permease n=1 Tax=Streptomyces sp. NPDC046915 TaxID=3155257 RepID=UPI0033C6B787
MTTTDVTARAHLSDGTRDDRLAHSSWHADGRRTARGTWPYRLAARLSAVNYLTVAPPRTLILSVLPRAVLQTAFYALLGQLSGGASTVAYALTGAVAYLAITPLVVRLPDIATEERYFGTMGRLLTAGIPVPAILAARCVPYLAEALGTWLAAALIVPVALHQASLTPHLLLALPAYLLVMLAAMSMGLLVTSTCLGRRSEVVLSNTLAYTVLALGGILPGPQPGVLAPLAEALPFRPALDLYRAQVNGTWDTEMLLRTLLLSAAWTAAAYAIGRALTYRSLRHGHHDLT